MQELRSDYFLTLPPLSIARYSFIQLSRLRRREENENANTSPQEGDNSAISSAAFTVGGGGRVYGEAPDMRVMY